MSSPTASPPFTKDVDFAKYGLAWTIDDTMKKLPDSFFSNISSVKENGNDISFNKPNGQILNLKKVQLLGAGSYGKAYLTDYKNDGLNTIVKIIDTTDFRPSEYNTLVYDTLQEVLVQILIYESTKDMVFPEIGLQGPFCPRFFCFGKSKDKIYILMERLDAEIITLLSNKKHVSHWSLAPAKIVRETTVQIAKILGILYNKLQFNHRDFKPDNIMYKIIDGKINVRLIDFGFSCLTYKNLKLYSTNPGTYSTKLHHCKSRSRDMHSYFYYLMYYTEYTKIQDCPVKRILQVLCDTDSPTPRNWAGTYMAYNEVNSNNSPKKTVNLDFDVVYNLFNELVLLTPNRSCSGLDPSWAKHIQIIYENMLSNLTDEEYAFTTETARESFLLNYLTKYGNSWRQSSDPNAFITSFKYRIRDLRTRSLGYTEFKASPKLLAELFKIHVKDYSHNVDKLGETILHKIARNPDVPEIESKLDLLISIGNIRSIINTINSSGKSALDLAVENNFTYAIEKLVELSNLLDINNSLPIIVKLYEINPKKVLSLSSSEGRNIFHNIAISPSELTGPLIDKLLENPSSKELINVRDNHQVYPLDYALQLNQVYIIKKLIEVDATANKTEFLFNIVLIKDVELLDKLIEKYFDRSKLNYQASGLKTPLIWATRANNIYLVKKLIELGAKTALKDDSGKTALHYASIKASKHEPNAFEIVKLLIEANPALPNIKNVDKRGPGNPYFATNKEVRNYIRSRKSGWFTKRKENTNKGKQTAGARKSSTRRSLKY